MPKKISISFEQYLRRRGYMFLSFDQAVLRIIKKSFSQKSFCGFWRMWNPYSGYIFFLLYSLIGGNRKRAVAISLIFLTSGFMFHDLVIYLVTGSISIVFTVTFSIYSVIFNIENKLLTLGKNFKSYSLRKNIFPLKYHVLLNMTLLFLPLLAGFLVNYIFFPDSVMNILFP